MPNAKTNCTHHYHNPNPFLTFCLTIFSYSSLFSLHIRAASTFAGLSSLGSANMLMTLINIFSTDCIGLHRSSAFSYPNWSSPGVCRIDMQTMPLGYTVHMSAACSSLLTFLLQLMYHQILPVSSLESLPTRVQLHLFHTLSRTQTAFRFPFNQPKKPNSPLGCQSSQVNLIVGGLNG